MSAVPSDEEECSYVRANLVIKKQNDVPVASMYWCHTSALFLLPSAGWSCRGDSVNRSPLRSSVTRQFSIAHVNAAASKSQPEHRSLNIAASTSQLRSLPKGTRSDPHSVMELLRKYNFRFQASNLFIVLGIHIGKNVILPLESQQLPFSFEMELTGGT